MVPLSSLVAYRFVAFQGFNSHPPTFDLPPKMKRGASSIAHGA
jgi:hypothetical protein